MKRKHTLGAKERLKSRKVISALFKNGKKLTASPLMIYYSISPYTGQTDQESHVNMGASVSSRFFRKAVDRNRIKRSIREAYRTQNESLKSFLKQENMHLDIFFIFTGRDMALLTEIKVKMTLILQLLQTAIIKK